MLQYTWDDFTADAKKIAGKVRERGGVKVIHPIPRGGLVLGLYLSHTLDIPLWLSGTPPHGPSVLVVDDNTVTGHSLAAFSNCLTAVLIHNPLTSSSRPSFYGRESLDWPVFPWEADSGVPV